MTAAYQAGAFRSRYLLPPRSGSLIAQSIAILRAKGGSWWQPGPAYTFTGSDGTGAAGDGSDAGYGVDLCATYGPELVVNGEFSTGTSSWGAVNAAIVAVSGELAITGAGEISRAEQTLTLVAGKVYEVSAYARKGTSDTSAMAVTIIRGAAGGYANVVYKAMADGTVRFVFIAPASDAIIQLINGGVGTAFFDNVSLREITGRPLLQPTTSFKPKLKRVPKRLGPELVASGDFASSAGWVVGSGWAISGGAAQATAGHPWSTVAQAAAALRAGVSYLVSADVSRSSGTLYAQLATVGASVTPFFATASGSFSGVATMPAGESPSIALLNDGAGAFVGSVDNLSVREVLEWTWAWQFDGADDYMASAESSLSQSPDYALIVAFNSRNRSGYRLALGVFAPGGQDHMALIGEAGESPVLTQYSRDISGSGGSTPSVVTGVSSSVGGRELRKNGAVVASAAYHPLTIEPRSIRMGLGVGGDNLTGAIFAAAYCPGQLSATERLIVERAMAQLAGVTI